MLGGFLNWKSNHLSFGFENFFDEIVISDNERSCVLAEQFLVTVLEIGFCLAFLFEVSSRFVSSSFF